MNIHNDSGNQGEWVQNDNPFSVFLQWYKMSVDHNHPDNSIMYLATASKMGKPSLRTVLLKGVENDSFIFFTNYESRKGQEIELNNSVALLFYWQNTGRQIRVEGKAEKISGSESDAYFESRPLLSRISAAASPQSRELRSRDELIQKWQEIRNKAESEIIRRPEEWGGYRVVPEVFEFWTAGDHRLHHRILYEKTGSTWLQKILAP